MSPQAPAPTCVFKDCEADATEGSRCCREHEDFFSRVRQEIEEDPMLIYNQRSDNPNRQLIDPTTGKRRKGKRKSLPVCCVPGCFEIRVPPDPYCDDHTGYAGGD